MLTSQRLEVNVMQWAVVVTDSTRDGENAFKSVNETKVRATIVL